MKAIKIFTIAAALLFTGLVSAAFVILSKGDQLIPRKGGQTALPVHEAGGFAVVELFTSEGCSSCPAADAVIARIEKESTGKPVYILAYHVDYWNRLGWKDVFSSPEFSRRQNTYANWLKLSSVYTPQVIVNGKTEFVGSQEGTLRNAIRTNLEKAPKAGLTLTDLKITGHQLTLKYTTDHTADTQGLLLALVQKTATTAVKNGENGGRTLSHVQIVNNFQLIPLTGKTGNARIILPADASVQNHEIIAFIQNLHTGDISTATSLALPPSFTASN